MRIVYVGIQSIGSETLSSIFAECADAMDIDYQYSGYDYSDLNEDVLLYDRLYEHGAGVPFDRRRAFELYLEAADKGMTEAKCRVGLMYCEGIGS